MTLEERLKQGAITQSEYDLLKQAEADKAVADEAQAWMDKVKAAPIQVKKQMVKEQSLNMQIESSLMDDGFEAKAKSKKAWNLRKSLRGAGGISF
mgnify:CR=1 FL=1